MNRRKAGLQAIDLGQWPTVAYTDFEPRAKAAFQTRVLVVEQYVNGRAIKGIELEHGIDRRQLYRSLDWIGPVQKWTTGDRQHTGSATVCRLIAPINTNTTFDNNSVSRPVWMAIVQWTGLKILPQLPDIHVIHAVVGWQKRWRKIFRRPIHSLAMIDALFAAKATMSEWRLVTWNTINLSPLS